MQRPNLMSLSHLIEDQTNFKQRYSEIQRYKFYVVYKKTPEQVMEFYARRIEKHLIKSDYGYDCWIPVEDQRIISVTGFTECLPTMEESEAFKIIYGKEILIPNEAKYFEL